MEEDPKMIKIGTLMDKDREETLVRMLKEYPNIYAWKLGDMLGIDPEVIKHELRTKPCTNPVKQKLRKVAPEYHRAVEKELSKLLDAGFIKKVRYPTWISNMFIVPKNSDGVRVCIDFTNLDKACLKNSYPLPSIDQLVEAVEGHEELPFMDGYSGYNQIALAEEGKVARIAKWNTQLEKFNIIYEIQTAQKSQVLVDFLEGLPLDNGKEVKDIPGVEDDGKDLINVLEPSSQRRRGLRRRI
ncbi:uncharacterized protein LOC113312854 [Papaver somniferum]|uniref:uncharacterized protein LOC113312854 n=1 Tax=Papaver somniferum TaxID=3469 RepID=UPI000E6F90F0|nr:uncharacterized protein LOC113312854 [Papaver somniferum]